MQANADFRAIEAVLAETSDQELSNMEVKLLVSQLAPAATGQLTETFVENARTVILRRRAAARKRSRIEAILPAVQSRWPQAQIEDCGDHLIIWLDGKPQVSAAVPAMGA